MIEVAEEAGPMSGETATIGPYSVIEDIVPGQWVAAQDPRLRRCVWLQKRELTNQTTTTGARRDVARPGRSRWLQSVETSEATWDVFEAQSGVPLPSLIDDGHLPWSSVRSWLYDIAMELAAAAQDDTLPEKLSLDHVWITAQDRAILLEEPWPATSQDQSPTHPSVSAELIQVDDLAGRQHFLHAIASRLNPVTVPLHAQSLLKNLAEGSFEKLSFVAGNLQSLLTKPVRVTELQRAASILFNPMILNSLAIGVFIAILMPVSNEMKKAFWYPVAFAIYAVMQLTAIVTGGSVLGEHNFGFAVIDAHGEKLGRLRLAVHWLIVRSLPLLWAAAALWNISQVDSLDAIEASDFQLTSLAFLVLVFPWLMGLANTVQSPHRGIHDQLTGCWIVPR